MILLQLLGGVAVTIADPSSDTAVPRRRALALLAVVAAAAPQPVAREKLLALLWPESDTARARNSLRQTIFALRRDLHEDIFVPEAAGGLQLDPAHIDADLWRFRDALARNAPDDALAVHRGPFLDGFHVPGLSAFAQWAEGERDRIERQHIAAIDRVAQCAAAQGHYEEAVIWRRRQAEADPLNSKAALALLEALAAAGDRLGALRYAAAHERLIRHELEIEPDPVVSEFVASLRRDAALLDGQRATPSDSRAWAATPVVTTPVVTTPAEDVSLDVGPDADVVVSAPISVRPHRRISRRRWSALGAGVLLTGTIAAAKWVTAGRGGPTADVPPIIILRSGGEAVSGRDPANRLVACHGPACPATPLPQDAFVVAPNAAYPAPPAGTNYIGPVADATTKDSPGYPCCTTATFETTFRLPPDAVSATISVSAEADNEASVAINGVSFGSQADSLSAANYTEPAQFTTTFAPDPSGTDHLRVTLWDGGGALGLHYIGTVTYETAPRTSKDDVTPPK